MFLESVKAVNSMRDSRIKLLEYYFLIMSDDLKVLRCKLHSLLALEQMIDFWWSCQVYGVMKWKISFSTTMMAAVDIS